MQHYVDTLPAMIHISSADPDGLKGVNVEKMQKSGAARGMALKSYHDAMDNKYQWCIIAVPSKKWAKKVFPGERTSAAVEKLWQAILETVRVSEDNDPMAEWEAHDAELQAHCEKLNALDLDYLHYQAPNGTDFKCWLIPGAQWHGGGDTLPDGTFFDPNMPTEEVFTSPVPGPLRGDSGLHHAPVLPGQPDRQVLHHLCKRAGGFLPGGAGPGPFRTHGGHG